MTPDPTSPDLQEPDLNARALLRRLLTFGKGVTMGMPDDVESRDPIHLFRDWFADAERAALLEPNAMTLATATADGRPSARMVLLKGHGEDGFVFYTNYASRKAAEIEANPQGALVFYWASLLRQVRVEGRIQRVSQAESRDYFRGRHRGSRIGAWASRQSEVLPARAELERRVEDYTRRFAGDDVPLPEFWGGYRVIPERIEFWQGRANRLHDRVLFERGTQGWTAKRLYP
jgi:pyridoxamine 5'-phosphate oxidase